MHILISLERKRSLFITRLLKIHIDQKQEEQMLMIDK